MVAFAAVAQPGLWVAKIYRSMSTYVVRPLGLCSGAGAGGARPRGGAGVVPKGSETSSRWSEHYGIESTMVLCPWVCT